MSSSNISSNNNNNNNKTSTDGTSASVNTPKSSSTSSSLPPPPVFDPSSVPSLSTLYTSSTATSSIGGSRTSASGNSTSSGTLTGTSASGSGLPKPPPLPIKSQRQSMSTSTSIRSSSLPLPPPPLPLPPLPIHKSKTTSKTTSISVTTQSAPDTGSASTSTSTSIHISDIDNTDTGTDTDTDTDTVKTTHQTLKLIPMESAPNSANINTTSGIINSNILVSSSDTNIRNKIQPPLPTPTSASTISTSTSTSTSNQNRTKPKPKRNITTQINPLLLHNKHKNTYAANTNNSLVLTPTQKSIPILIISTRSSQELIQSKNNMSISQLFTTFANSIGFTSYSNVSSGGSHSSSHSNSSSGIMRLPPLRSINGKSIQLKWDELQFIFYNGSELDDVVGLENTANNNSDINQGDPQQPYYSNGTLKSWLHSQNEQMLHHATRDENWSSLGDGATGTNTLSTEDIESHIEQLLLDPTIYSSTSSTMGDSSATATATSTFPSVSTTSQNAKKAYQHLVASNSKTPWLLRFRHVLNTISSTTTTTAPSSTSTTGTTSNDNDNDDNSTIQKPYYDNMLSCPPLILFIASTKDDHPIDALYELSSSNLHLPKVCQNGFFNVNSMKKCFLVLQDNNGVTGGGTEDALLHEMKLKLGKIRPPFKQNTSHKHDGSSSTAGGKTSSSSTHNSYHVLHLNSLSSSSSSSEQQQQHNQVQEDAVYDTCLHPKPWPTNINQFIDHDIYQIRGSSLSTNDKISIQRFVSSIVCLNVIPSIEKRIYNLNVEVTNAKKGVKNAFKSFWRKPKESGSNLSNSIHGGSIHGGGSVSASASFADRNDVPTAAEVFYRFDSIESQTRLLADTLFIIKDYDSALSMYRLVKDDYKHDSNIFHYASTHEMMALCLYMIDEYNNSTSTTTPNTRDIIYNLETAITLYGDAAHDDPILQNAERLRASVASVATRCVTRLSLLRSSSWALCYGRDMDIAKNLAFASTAETPLGAAVLLEQSASHYYRAGMYRKFAHHILMAGHMFRQAGQEQHSLRCFTAAMHIYHGSERGWVELNDHVSSALAGQLYAMKRMRLCLPLYAKLIGTTGMGRVTVKSHQKFLDHLMKICRGYPSDAFQSVECMNQAYNQGQTILTKDGGKSFNENHHDKYDQILKDAPGAKRVLEIPHIDLPKIDDSTIKVENAALSNTQNSIHFGTKLNGSEAVWQELMCSTNAELSTIANNDYIIDSLSPETFTEQVISNMDKEKSKAAFMARSIKNSGQSAVPAVRAIMEPTIVSFLICNPLGFQVPVSSLQLVARFKCAATGRIYTNEAAIFIPTTSSEDTLETKQWKFSGSDEAFHLAHFSRLSSGKEGQQGNIWTSPCLNNVEPFFVVTKKAMPLDPMSNSTISLSICPLVTGDLEILGVRCKIFNEIWVYHQFNVLGPLLQNSTLNRGNRVRGEPMLLKSKIECNMPNLAMDIVSRNGNVSLQGPMLQGQVSDWTLRVTNQGTAAACNVVLKTNIPWINIITNSDSISDVAKESSRKTSFCVGPSGSLMRLPIASDDSDSRLNILSPGETVDIPIQIRTSGGGRQDCYMLFRYELYEQSSSEVSRTPFSSKCRWLRNMVSVAVYPSLTVTASLMPFHGRMNDHILSVEMTNYRSDKQSENEINVNNISIVSKHYSVKPLVAKDIINKSKMGHSVGWQEQMTMHYVVSPTNSDDSTSCTLSECLLGGINSVQQINGGMTTTDFISLEHAHDKFKIAVDQYRMELAALEAENEKEGQHPRSIAQIRRARDSTIVDDGQSKYEGGSQFHPTSLKNLCTSPHSSSEINVICSWTTTGNRPQDVIVGQHHLRQLAVRPEYKSKGCPILISASYDTSIYHDFSDGPLVRLIQQRWIILFSVFLFYCVFPNQVPCFFTWIQHLDMKIIVRNRLVKSKVDFIFSLSQKQDFDFVGSERFSSSLAGGEELVFPLQAVLFNSGIYDLQCVKITVRNEDGSETPYMFPLQWNVKVN